MTVKFEPNRKGIFSIRKWAEVEEVVEERALDIAKVAQSTVRKTKKRSQWHVTRSRRRDDDRHMFRVETDRTRAGRQRAAIIVGSPDKIGRRDGRIALKKAARFGSVEGIEAHKTKLKARRAAKSVKRFDIFYSQATGKSFL